MVVSIPSPSPTAGPPTAIAQVSTLGDIDATEPTKKILRFQPLANYLAQHLNEHGIERGEVVIARNIEEMARFLREGQVDIYFDSPFPTLAVQELSGSRIILRRWKGGLAEYWSTYIVLRASGISSAEGFVVKVIAFEEPASTSGFLMPWETLIQQGFNLMEVASPGSQVPSDRIGYFFSGDPENTVELLLRGEVVGGGVSNQDYEELPPELEERIVAFDRSITVPRQLVSVRDGLDDDLVTGVVEILAGLNQTDEGRLLLDGLKKTMMFDTLPPQSETSLSELRRLMRLVSGE